MVGPFMVREKSTWRIWFTLTSETGAGIPAVDLITLTLTYYDKETLVAINSGTPDQRTGQDVLNKNGVAIDANGKLTWTMTPVDTVILNALGIEESHIALFQWTWGAGKAGHESVEIIVQNEEKIP